MGMFDVNLRFSRGQVLPAATGDMVSTGCYDGGNALTSDVGLSEALRVNVVCSSPAASTGAATVQAVLQDSTNGLIWADVCAGPVVQVASLTAGAVLLQSPVPVGTRRWLQIVYRVGTAGLTAGAFDAYVSAGVQRNTARPSRFSVQ